jgi:hypothetical protein
MVSEDSERLPVSEDSERLPPESTAGDSPCFPTFLEDDEFWTKVRWEGERVGRRVEGILDRELAEESEDVPAFLDDDEFWTKVRLGGELTDRELEKILDHELAEPVADNIDERWAVLAEVWKGQAFSDGTARIASPPETVLTIGNVVVEAKKTRETLVAVSSILSILIVIGACLFDPFRGVADITHQRAATPVARAMVFVNGFSSDNQSGYGDRIVVDGTATAIPPRQSLWLTAGLADEATHYDFIDRIHPEASGRWRVELPIGESGPEEAGDTYELSVYQVGRQGSAHLERYAQTAQARKFLRKDTLPSDAVELASATVVGLRRESEQKTGVRTRGPNAVELSSCNGTGRGEAVATVVT